MSSFRQPCGDRLLALTLPATAAAAATARRAVSAVLPAAAYSSETREVAELLVSELVTNVLLHAGGDVHVDVSRRPSRTRIAVSDQGPGRPVLRHSAPEDLGGRGLLLVERLASDWGWERQGAGKAVWFELPG